MKLSWLLLLALAACSTPFESRPDGAQPPADSSVIDVPDAGIQPGDPNILLLTGVVVAPDRIISGGEVLVDNGVILCVEESCASHEKAPAATKIETGGIIYPGLIDAHNHTQYNYLPLWQHSRPTYSNHNQWQSDSEYKAFTSLHGQLDGELMCEMVKYGEIRSLVAGTTTIQGTPLRKCADTLIRNADLPYHGIPSTPDVIRTNVLGISQVDPSDAQQLLQEFRDGETWAYVLHLAEGIDETARKEFDQLEALGLLQSEVVVIHGTALGSPELTKIKQFNMPMIWSPSSNLDLYGATNDIPTAVSLGIHLSLSPDWTPSGEPNMLDEIQVVTKLNKDQYGEIWTPKQIFEMATIRPAEALKFGDYLGLLKPGMQADILVLAAAGDPYQAIASAKLSQVRLVLVKGKALYGEPGLMQTLAPNEYCESVTICSTPKTLCVKSSESSTDKLNQSYGDIENLLGQAYTPGIMPIATNCD